jgi:hypothetical protein
MTSHLNNKIQNVVLCICWKYCANFLNQNLAWSFFRRKNLCIKYLYIAPLKSMHYVPMPRFYKASRGKDVNARRLTSVDFILGLIQRRWTYGQKLINHNESTMGTLKYYPHP